MARSPRRLLVQLSLLYWLLLLVSSLECRWELNYLRVVHPPRQYGHLTMSYTKSPDGLHFFSSSAKILEDLGRQKQRVEFYLPETPKDENCNYLYFQSQLDLCKVAQGTVATLFMRTFLDGFLKKADHAISCTTPKGVYNSTNFIFNETMYPPLRAVNRFRVIFKFSALKLNNRTWVSLYTVHLSALQKKVVTTMV